MTRAVFSRRRRKVDANQREIVAALRAAGYAVHVLHRVGDGFPDLLAAHPADGLNILVEVKMPGGKLMPAEAEFLAVWPGARLIADSGEQALKQLALLRAALQETQQ